MNEQILESVNQSLKALEIKTNKLKLFVEQSDNEKVKVIAAKTIEAMNLAAGKLKAAAIDSNYADDMLASVSFLDEKTNSLYINALTKIKEEMSKAKNKPTVVATQRVETLVETKENETNVEKDDDQLSNKIIETLQEWMRIGE